MQQRECVEQLFIITIQSCVNHSSHVLTCVCPLKADEVSVDLGSLLEAKEVADSLESCVEVTQDAVGDVICALHWLEVLTHVERVAAMRVCLGIA